MDSDYYQYYQFIGRIIGLAIHNRVYLSIPFNLSIYKRLLDIPLETSDLKYIDSELFKNLQQLKYVCNYYYVLLLIYLFIICFKIIKCYK